MKNETPLTLLAFVALRCLQAVSPKERNNNDQITTHTLCVCLPLSLSLSLIVVDK
jgi:hypothetical protein